MQFPSRTAKFIGCWQAVTEHTLARYSSLIEMNFWWLVEHAYLTVNCWVSQSDSLLGKQAASTQCHPQFGSGSHMTPQGWPSHSLPVCLLTSHSSCQPVMKLKCQHRHLSFTPTSSPHWTHTQPCHPCGTRSACLAAALFANGLHIKAWAVDDSGPDCFVSAISHTFTHTLAPQSLCLIALLQCVEVQGREGSIKIWALGKTGSGGMRKEEEGDKREREVGRGDIKKR